MKGIALKIVGQTKTGKQIVTRYLLPDNKETKAMILSSRRLLGFLRDNVTLCQAYCIKGQTSANYAQYANDNNAFAFDIDIICQNKVICTVYVYTTDNVTYV